MPSTFFNETRLDCVLRQLPITLAAMVWALTSETAKPCGRAVPERQWPCSLRKRNLTVLLPIRSTLHLVPRQKCKAEKPVPLCQFSLQVCPSPLVYHYKASLDTDETNPFAFAMATLRADRLISLNSSGEGAAGTILQDGCRFRHFE